MGDRLEEGEKLLVGNSLTSKNGAYKLTLQKDGNLVLYSGDDAVWATATDGQNVERAEVQKDGNFVLYTPDKAVWASQTKGAEKVLLVLQDDRNLVLYSEKGPVWKSDTHTDEAPPAPKVSEAPVVEAEVVPAAVEEPTVEAPAEPAPPPPPPPPPAPRTYTVVSGDTLWAIAEKFYGDGSKYPQIAEASGVPNPDLIHPGQVLTIP
jgi:nucleoid-associated protein YgaU